MLLIFFFYNKKENFTILPKLRFSETSKYIIWKNSIYLKYTVLLAGHIFSSCICLWLQIHS